jgi:hypothetical protein
MKQLDYPLDCDVWYLLYRDKCSESLNDILCQEQWQNKLCSLLLSYRNNFKAEQLSS